MNTSIIDNNSILSRRTQQLAKIEFFAGISEQALLELAGLMKEQVLKKNTVVINQGDSSRNLFVICSGRLKVFATNEEGDQTIFTFLGPDDFFGELSLLDDAPRSASVITLEDTIALSLNYQSFSEFINNHPEVCWSLFKSLTTRIRIMDETICTLTSRDIYGRLVETLYNEAEEQDDGTFITQKLTHQDLAEMIGSSREMISRIFKDLRQGDYIKVEKKQVTILKKLPSRW